MKGTFFQKPLEFRVQVSGEEWHQGTLIEGELSVKNHGENPLPLKDVHVLLAHGDTKKIKAKKEDSFQVLSAADFSELGTLESGAECTDLKWNFQLDPNAPISDKSGSPCLLYGTGQNPLELGYLQLNILPDPLFLDFIDAVSIEFRFVVKFIKNKKNHVEVKFAPPSGKDFAFVENLFVLFCKEEDHLKIQYTFNTKSLNATDASSLSVKKSKQQFEHEFSPAQYLLSFNQRLNKDFIEKQFSEILEELSR